MKKNKNDLPWSNFFWSDYDGDEALRVCSLEAQGLWMRLLCAMARATPKGELRIGGRPCTVPDIAKMASTDNETAERLLQELRDRGVYSLTREGVIFSRRIKRDVERSRKAVKNGKLGGNPSLGKTSVKPQSVNLPDKPQYPIPPSNIQNLSSSDTFKLPRDDGADDFENLDRSLRAIPGVDRHPVGAIPVISPIWQLARAGVSVRKVILPSIARQVATAKGPIRSWSYFVPGIEQDARGRAVTSASVSAVIVSRKEWLSRLRSARPRKAWPVAEWGPMPGTPECTCPADLLEADDGNGWATKFETAA